MIPWRKTNKNETKPADRVLVIQLGELNEFVPALAAAKRIREHHMGARITLLTRESMRPLAEKCPYFDTVETDAPPGATVAGAMAATAGAAVATVTTGQVAEPPALVKLITRIRQAKYDIVYDLEGSARTANYFRALRPWPPRWSGPVAGAAFAYLEKDRSLHTLDRLGAQLAVAGIGDGVLSPPDLSWLRAALRDPPRLKPDYFGIRGPYVVLLPRGSDAAPARRWAPDKYEDLARRIASYGVTPVILGGSEERNLGAAIAAKVPQAKNLVTRAELFQCIGLFERASFVLGDDVDLLQAAAASGAPCLALLSSSNDPAKATPRGRGGVVALTAAVVADLPVEQVERQLRNCGVFRQAATA
ncbi:ADP-heptose--lipooligosaccharide heptosyltransferase II [alpha proteobacterium U9-1i]|nr:ADP-heptose--lipooligosaccharide heptosyltransferase II [alpha proteobacterium U9-1i]